MTERWKTRKSLILRARDPDDSRAWEKFVQYYQRFIFHVLHRMNVSSADFDDLVQNVSITLEDINPSPFASSDRVFRIEIASNFIGRERLNFQSKPSSAPTVESVIVNGGDEQCKTVSEVAVIGLLRFRGLLDPMNQSRDYSTALEGLLATL